MNIIIIIVVVVVTVLVVVVDWIKFVFDNPPVC